MPRGKKAVIPENIEEKIAEAEKEIAVLTAKAPRKRRYAGRRGGACEMDKLGKGLYFAG